MTTFNFKNYRVEPAADPGLPKETVTPGVPDQTETITPQMVESGNQGPDLNKAAEATTGLGAVQIVVTGPVAEIVANALNGIFKNSNLSMYDEESILRPDHKSYIVSLEETTVEVTDSVPVVYCVNMSSINSNPSCYTKELKNIVKKFSAETNRSIYLYINTEGRAFSSAYEELFLVNVPSVVKKMFFSVESTVNYIRSSIKTKEE